MAPRNPARAAAAASALAVSKRALASTARASIALATTVRRAAVSAINAGCVERGHARGSGRGIRRV